MSFTRRIALPIALALAVGLVVGCGRMPTAPNVTTQAGAEVASPAAEPGGLGSTIGDALNQIVKTIELVGDVGGTLTNGRWTVDVPPRAVDGNGSVSITVVSANSPGCQLDITPVTLNQFSTPVTLTADCSSVPSAALSNYVIYWFNPGTRQWVQVAGSKVDLTRKVVTAPLKHFSQYSVGPSGGSEGGSKGGRAGW